MMESKRAANSKVVQMALRPALKQAKQKAAEAAVGKAPLFALAAKSSSTCNPVIVLVAGGGFEPPTFGL